MKILKPWDIHNSITAEIEGRWVKAKVFAEPSTFGINNGRVSKLAVAKTNERNPFLPFFEQMAYNYDRGLDFDDLPPGVLNRIVGALEDYVKERTG